MTAAVHHAASGERLHRHPRRHRRHGAGGRWGRVVLLATAALLLAGCRIDVTTGVVLAADGAGELAVTVRIDGATLRQLDELGVDPGLDVALALDPSSGWRVERLIDADGGLVLTHRRGFVDGAELTALLHGLSEGLARQDPAIRFVVDAVTDRRGALVLSGTGGIAPPATTGVLIDGVPLGPSDDELARLTQDAVRARLIIDLPGDVVSHDGDRASARRVEWDLPVGDQRTLTLQSQPGAWWARVPWRAVLVLAVAGAVAALVVRRVTSTKVSPPPA